MSPKPRLEDHPLSAVIVCLFTLFEEVPSISGGRSSIRSVRTLRTVVTRTYL